MKLQILVPQYTEDETIIKPLLDSLAIQQNIDFSCIGVIIANDGTDVILSEDFLNSYPFKIEYLKLKHKGVSATRDACFRKATADYVMFCDIDDMFFHAYALYTIFREMENQFDTLFSVFVEEGIAPDNNDVHTFIHRENDTTFVHGKVFRRKFLKNNNIYWNHSLTIHEDSFFNVLAQSLTNPSRFRYIQTPFYIWKWRDESVCRRDPKYILKTFVNMLDSNTALVEEFIDRGMLDKARTFATSMIFDSYLSLNKDEWLLEENKEFRDITEKRIAKHLDTFWELFETTPEQEKNQILVGVKNRMFAEGLFLEKMTFSDWLTHIKSIGEE